VTKIPTTQTYRLPQGNITIDAQTSKPTPEDPAQGELKEATESEWSNLSQQDNSLRLHKEALASAVSSGGLYGEHSLEEYAK
jgi:hypothetical protein